MLSSDPCEKPAPGDAVRIIDPAAGTDSGEGPRWLSVPGFIDVHVHFRDPGDTDSETLETGAAAAAAGGIAAVVTMPNTVPPADSPQSIRRQIGESAALPVEIWPSACISRGRAGRETADLEALAEAGAVAFTDDGSFVDDAHVMEDAMRRAAKLRIPLMQHAVVPALLAGGVIRDCAVARRFALPVMPPEAETKAVERDISIVRVTGCALHVQHVSCAGTVELVRAAQREGLPVTCEATPHHLLLSCDDIPGDDACWKMAPPLGFREDVAALREGVMDGTVSMFATDHAPHCARKKQGGFRNAANGITGLETAIAATWHAMVEEEGMSPLEWVRRWTTGPAALLRKTPRRRTLIDLRTHRRVDPDAFRTKSRNQPYSGMDFAAWPVQTGAAGEI